jgi:Zn-dependent peptidase ImmA (M78 family)
MSRTGCGLFGSSAQPRALGKDGDVGKRPDVDAIELLHRLRIGEVPVPLEYLAKSLAISVSYQPFDGDISGMLYRDDERVVIGVNSQESAVRQRFTIAHEIGHFRLHPGHDVRIDRLVRVNFRGEASSTWSNKEEVEANSFAAELLMPKERLQREVVKAIDRKEALSDRELVERLAQRFAVSRQAMAYRLANLAILDPR